MRRKVEIAILGSGTAGLAALAQIKHKTDDYVLINGGEPGTICARVGCMPSKAMIQVAEDFHRRHIFNRHGISGGEDLQINVADAMEHVRDLRDIFVDRVLAGTTDQMGDEFIEGYARFIAPNLLEVNGEQIEASRIIIATGSSPVIPAQWREFGDRILTTDSIFEQEDLPQTLAVVGLGVVGLELGQAMAWMGVKVTGVDQQMFVGGLSDPEVNRTAIELLSKDMDLWLGEPAQLAESGDKIEVRSGENVVVVDKVLASMGRRPNTQDLNLQCLGLELDQRGLPPFDPTTMQIGDLPVFFAGDVVNEKAVLHEAADEGKIAGRNACAETITAYRRRVPLAITFCDPNIAVVGQPVRELHLATITTGTVRLGPLGRALIMGRNRGMLRVYASTADARIVGAEMVCPGGEHIAQLLALAIQQQLTVNELLRLPFYHPTLEEALQGALKDLRGNLYSPGQHPFELAK